MKNLNLLFVLVAMLLFTACKDGNEPISATNAQSNTNIESENQNSIVFTVDGKKILPTISYEKSELKFYSNESILNVDAACDIASTDDKQQISIVIEGIGKGLDELSGNVDVEQTHSVVDILDGKTQYNFTKGIIEVTEFSKNTGKVKLKIKGECVIKNGSSYKDMKVDIPAELVVDATISNIRTFNYTTPKNK